MHASGIKAFNQVSTIPTTLGSTGLVYTKSYISHAIYHIKIEQH